MVITPRAYNHHNSSCWQPRNTSSHLGKRNARRIPSENVWMLVINKSFLISSWSQDLVCCPPPKIFHMLLTKRWYETSAVEIDELEHKHTTIPSIMLQRKMNRYFPPRTCVYLYVILVLQFIHNISSLTETGKHKSNLTNIEMISKTNHNWNQWIYILNFQIIMLICCLVS